MKYRDIILEYHRQIFFSYGTTWFESSRGLQKKTTKRTALLERYFGRGYNATHLRKRGIRIFQMEQDKFLLGKTELPTPFGNMVAVYDKERAYGKCDRQINRTTSMDKNRVHAE